MIIVNKHCIAKYPVTKLEYDAIYKWAKLNGYTDLSIAYGTGNQPAGCITWYDAVKFCNALSELAGLIPVYYDETEQIYRCGMIDITEKNINYSADGYRLLHSQEWEYACRAGSNSKYFWGEEYSKANEYAWHSDGSSRSLETRPVGLKKPNGFGLYDMIGNVYEWCFDQNELEDRILRGGSLAIDSNLESGFVCATSAEYKCYETGFRIASSNLTAPDVEAVAKKSGHYSEHIPYMATYPDMDEKAIALRLLGYLGNTDNAQRVKELIQKYEYRAAIKEFKKQILHSFKKHSLEQDINFDIYFKIEKFTKAMPEIMNSDKNIKWFGKPNEVIAYADGRALLCVAVYYYKTKDEKYLLKFIELINSFLLRHKAEYDALDSDGLNTRQIDYQSWAWSNGFIPCMRMHNIIYAMWCIINTAQENQVPDCMIAQFAVSMMSDHLNTMLKDNRDAVPNQRIYVLNGFFLLVDLFPDFKKSDGVKRKIKSILKDTYESMIYPDGTMLEQSFNYNHNVLNDYCSLKNRLADKNIFSEVDKHMLALSNMFFATMLPTGDLPPTGTIGSVFPPDLSVDKMYEKKVLPQLHKKYNKIDNLNLEGLYDRLNKGIVGFNSVFFPYSGQAIIRESFDIEARYMFFYAPRKGKGHSVENINDIYFQAYGRPMLINAGASSYGMKGHFSLDQADYIADIDRYQHSSFGRNTICVDGMSQSRLKNGEMCVDKKYTNCIGNRYHESDEFVFVEGSYQDGYYSCDDVVHIRKIIYHKKSRLFFILDTMCAKNPHIYSQNWGFMPKNVKQKIDSYEWIAAGYDDCQIIAEENKIYTCDIGHPNIHLYQFSNCNMTYKRFNGELNPARGWFAPEIMGRRYPKTDIEASWQTEEDISSVLTVVEATSTEKSEILSIKKLLNEQKCGCVILTSNGDTVTAEFDIGKQEGFFVITHSARICESEEIKKNGDKIMIKSPENMFWKEHDGVYKPVYE